MKILITGTILLLFSFVAQAEGLKKADGWDEGYFSSKPRKPEPKGIDESAIEQMIDRKLKKQNRIFRKQAAKKDKEIEELRQQNLMLQEERRLKEERIAKEKAEYIRKRKKSYLFESFEEEILPDEEMERQKVYLGKSIKIYEASPAIDLDMVITAEKMIPAVILTPVNSEISSVATAVVERNVLGTQGNKILIPAGSKVLGEFAEVKSKGARRMSVKWNRIITPQGVNIMFTGNAHDKMGYSGIATKRDERIKERYGAAFAVSLLNTISQLSIDASNAVQAAGSASFAREMGTLTAQILKDNSDLPPIILIKQGERFNIYPKGDILFSKVKNRSIRAEYINITKVANNGGQRN